MKEIIEEYGEILLAMIGAVSVLTFTGAIFYGEFSKQIAQYVVGL